ncbi:hypothetical protein [Alteromonas antoniana]|uniref:hypothetical protein n=1 Tax=Alteromonas antoniana TaxID=2803813 RepID=UPI001C454800|nr:hypothetical protein [Alteromonas antoniana]
MYKVVGQGKKARLYKLDKDGEPLIDQEVIDLNEMVQLGVTDAVALYEFADLHNSGVLKDN